MSFELPPKFFEIELCSRLQCFGVLAIQWWTGEDSNLRSPQGAADLQSAGFSHSPTRPARTPGLETLVPTGELRNAERARVRRHQPVHFSMRGIHQSQTQNFRSFKVSWRRDLNPRPSDYKSDALPTELRQQKQTLQTYHAGNQIASGCDQPARLVPSWLWNYSPSINFTPSEPKLILKKLPQTAA